MSASSAEGLEMLGERLLEDVDAYALLYEASRNQNVRRGFTPEDMPEGLRCEACRLCAIPGSCNGKEAGELTTACCYRSLRAPQECIRRQILPARPGLEGALRFG